MRLFIILSNLPENVFILFRYSIGMDLSPYYSWLAVYGIQQEWIYGFVVIILGLLFGRFVSLTVNRLLENLAKKTHTTVDDMVVGNNVALVRIDDHTGTQPAERAFA